eukprot:COSAG04_NODE_1716_length_5818_cov_7.652387_2_plen_469_part_00
MTAKGIDCDAWGENDFEIPEDSNRCAAVDGIARPWCFVAGAGEDDWDYCEDAAKGPAVAGCTRTAKGVDCDSWGENDFGLPEDSNECAAVDGLEKPWCYVNEEDWDYCNCGEGGAPLCDHTKDEVKCADWGENIWGLAEDSSECWTAEGVEGDKGAGWCFVTEADGKRPSPDDAPEETWGYCACNGPGPVRKPKNTFMGSTEQYMKLNGEKRPMMELAMEGRVRVWWWDIHHPFTDTLNEHNFDLLTHRKDFYVVMFYLPDCDHCESVSGAYERTAELMMRKHHNIAFGRVNAHKTKQSTRAPTPEEWEEGIEPGMYYGDDAGKFGGAPVADWYKIERFPFGVMFQYGKRNPDIIEVEAGNVEATMEWLEKKMMENRIKFGVCEEGETMGPGEACDSNINLSFTDPANPYISEYDHAKALGYDDPRETDKLELQQREDGTLFTGPEYKLPEGPKKMHGDIEEAPKEDL